MRILAYKYKAPLLLVPHLKSLGKIPTNFKIFVEIFSWIPVGERRSNLSPWVSSDWVRPFFPFFLGSPSPDLVRWATGFGPMESPLLSDFSYFIDHRWLPPPSGSSLGWRCVLPLAASRVPWPWPDEEREGNRDLITLLKEEEEESASLLFIIFIYLFF